MSEKTKEAVIKKANEGYKQAIQNVEDWQNWLHWNIKKVDGEEIRTGLQKKLKNVRLVLENDPKVNGRISYNAFANKVEKTSPLGLGNDNHNISVWQDDDTRSLLMFFSEYPYNVELSKEMVENAVRLVAKQNPFHPVQEYIQNQKWDGKKRIDTLFIDLLEAEDNSYTRAVTRLWFIGAVKRIFEPACKFDYVPILEGSQGVGKSTLIQKLANDWYTNDLKDFHSQESLMIIHGSTWIVELDELSSFKKSEVEEIKKFVSSTTDDYKEPYAHHPVRRERHIVMIGTTNQEEYLKDITGDRRFLPIPCKKKYEQADKRIFEPYFSQTFVPQLWAEAYELYELGFKNDKNPLILSDTTREQARNMQNQAREKTLVETATEEFINELKVPTDFYNFGKQNQQNYVNQYFNSDESAIIHIGNKQYSQKNLEPIYKIHPELILYGYLKYRYPEYKKSDEYIMKDIRAILNNMDGWEYKTSLVTGYSKTYRSVGYQNSSRSS